MYQTVSRIDMCLSLKNIAPVNQLGKVPINLPTVQASGKASVL